jgi:small-conductance mechanosensitive channel
VVATLGADLAPGEIRVSLGSVIALAATVCRITLLTGAFGVGIGFGLQNVIQNFASGLILLFERPVQVGDKIQLAGLEGEVLRIGMRSCTLRTGDGAEVIVPNADLITEQVTNWTLSDRLRRVDVPVGVAYGSDPELVLRVLREVVGLHPDVCAAPPPVALFIGFGAGSLDFRLSAWTEAADWTRVRSDLGVRVNAALRDEGIRFPAPPSDTGGKGR